MALFLAVTEIEDQLTALGERWSHTCQWTLQQLERLQTLKSRWTMHTDLLHACDEHETALKEVSDLVYVHDILLLKTNLQHARHWTLVELTQFCLLIICFVILT